MCSFISFQVSQIVAMVKMRAVIEKEIALIMHEIIIVDA